MKLHTSIKSESGQTLVEALMALSVLGITGAGVMTAFNNGFFMMGQVRENQRATQIMLEKVETIRLYSWDQVNTPGFIPTSFTNFYDPQAVSGSQGVEYHGTLTRSDFPYSTSYTSNMCQFTITLNWTSPSGLNRTRTFTTYIARDGVQNYVY